MGDQNHNHVAIQIKALLEEAEPLFTTKCCIYRVPHEIHKLNPAAYTPKVVSIGPFHYANKKLRNMESHKQIYCQKFIERAKLETTFDNLISCVQDLEPTVRLYYSDNIKLSVHEFVKVVLIDCGFILEFFLSNYFGEWTDEDVIPLKPWLTSHIKLDLVLLENQLPLFVLEKLYNLAFASRQNGKYPSFLELVFHYFDDYNKLKLHATAATSIEHFTDLLRTFHLQPSSERSSRGEETISHINSATELNEAGVKFEVNKQSHCLLDLTISGRHDLKIPEFRVEDWTEILFRNMVALEQCHYPDKSYITDYVAVMSFLIKTGKDVDLLVQKKIIVNWLGDSNAVAKLFNGLWKNITQVGFNSNYVGICRELNAFCAHPWYRRKATLRRDYCRTPWQKVASFAAILVLILTITQTVFSILQVVLN